MSSAKTLTATDMRAPDAGGLSFAGTLRWALDNKPAARKGERTRGALIWATATLLNERGYHDVRISDICKRGGVSSAAFYQYFENKAAITCHALNAFSDFIFETLARRSMVEDNREALFQANSAWLSLARHNVGLMRSVLQVGMEIPDVAIHYERINRLYGERVAAALARRSGHTPDTARLLTAALSSMTDDFTRRMLSQTDTDLADTVKRALGDDEALAAFLTDIWYNAIYQKAPA